MALKIRLRQQGRKNRTSYRLVVADARSPRDGKYVEMLGWYNPVEATAEKSLHIKAERVQHWLSVGAQMTDNARALVCKCTPHLTQAQTAQKLDNRAKKNNKKRADKSE